MAKLNIHGVLAMLGRQSSHQYKFFLTGFNLEKRTGEDHILRRRIFISPGGVFVKIVKMVIR